MKITLRKMGFLCLLAAVFPALFFSCSSEEAIGRILGTALSPPVFLECRPLSPEEILFGFSAPVRLLSLNFNPALEVASVEEGAALKIKLVRAAGEGKKFVADVLVEDADRNTLNVIVPFRGKNNRMPAVVINEIRTENTKPKAEFVEFRALEAGNLGAMKLFIAEHSLTEPLYEFPPAEVNAGDYVTLHLRATEEGCADETGSGLDLSGGTDARKDARDFWIFGNKKLIHRTGAVWFQDQDGRIIDAVVLRGNTEEWGKYNSALAADFLRGKGAWPAAGENPLDIAVDTTKTTNTQTICRDKDIPPCSGAAGWYVTVKSGATPGKENNPKRL